jgi:hypothetical protein
MGCTSSKAPAALGSSENTLLTTATKAVEKDSPKRNSKVFKVGDAVEVVATGTIGVVVGQDGSSKPYLIKLDNGLVSWYSRCSFRATTLKPKPRDDTVEDIPLVVEHASAENSAMKAEEMREEVEESLVEPLLIGSAAVVSMEARRDTVEVVATGMIGTIVGRDGSSLPYLIKLDNGLVSWYSKDQVQANAKDEKLEDVPVNFLQAEPIVEYNSANNNVSWFCCK